MNIEHLDPDIGNVSPQPHREFMRDPRSIPRRLAAMSGASIAGLSAIYAAVLVAGLLTIPAPDAQIANPWFTLMEVLILLIAPMVVAFSISVHAWVPDERQGLALLAVVFLSICAALTMTVHFTVLSLSRHPLFVDPVLAKLLFSFQWPSVAYALDILAWDVAFPIGALAMGLALSAVPGTRTVRRLLLGSSALSFIGLIGVPLNDMRLRNVGIVGYAVLFPIATGIMATTLLREAAEPERQATLY